MPAPVTPEAPAGGTPIPSGSPSPTIPPTNPAPGQPTNVDTTRASAGSGVPQEELDKLKQLTAAQEATLRDYHRQNSELTQRLREYDGRIKKIEAGPEATVEDQNTEFWKNPVGVMNKLIREELTKTVGPLNDRISRETALSAYDRAKLALKTQYADIWDKIEPSIDSFVQRASQQGIEVNEELMNIAALTASGALYRGQIPNVAAPTHEPAPPTPPNGAPTNVFTPPHLRPSAPPIPGAEPDKKEQRQLSENERRLARERKMSDEQYLSWLDVPPESVATSSIGKEEKK